MTKRDLVGTLAAASFALFGILLGAVLGPVVGDKVGAKVAVSLTVVVGVVMLGLCIAWLRMKERRVPARQYVNVAPQSEAHGTPWEQATGVEGFTMKGAHWLIDNVDVDNRSDQNCSLEFALQFERPPMRTHLLAGRWGVVGTQVDNPTFPITIPPRTFHRLRLYFPESIHVVPSGEPVRGTFRLVCIDKVSRQEWTVPIPGKGALDLTPKPSE